MSEPKSTDSAGFVPAPDDVRAVFGQHFSNYEDTSGEVSYQQFQNEQSIRRQYSGRVLYELLQNALDRANRNVIVEIREVDWGPIDRALVVGNDGIPIKVDPNYDYSNPPETKNERRPDFNALCSLHTSNKLPEQSVGNKGIGFRSVFWLGDFVRVWSRFNADPGWWGMEMHSPLDLQTWQNRAENPEISAGYNALLENREIPLTESDERPSFHLPLPLRAEQPPTPSNCDDLSTIIVVPILSSRLDELRHSLDTLRDGHLNFVGLFEDRRNLNVEFKSEDGSFSKSTWPRESSPSSDDRLSISYWNSPRLAPLAEDAELELSAPGAAIAWPDEPTKANKDTISDRVSRVYGYLPTLIESPFNIDVQGDFQLRTDRTGLRLDDETIGSYNRKLLEVAAELHLYRIITEVGSSSANIGWEWIEPNEVQTAPEGANDGVPRTDFWSLLNPKSSSSEAGEVVCGHLESLLFPNGGPRDAERYKRWADLAEQYFEAKEAWPVQTYREFWIASEGWIDRACRYSSGTKTWRQTAAALGDALREVEAYVAPVTSKKELPDQQLVPAVPLPERGDAADNIGQEARHTRRLFLRRSEETDLGLPQALREANRAVTSFDFPPGFSDEPPQPLGADQFNRWDVLRELRQLPNSIESWSFTPLHENPDKATEFQVELIRFAMELYGLESQGGAVSPAEHDGYGPGWRAMRQRGYSDNARTAGRSIATLFLPTTNGQWEPARQLTLGRVDYERLPEPREGVDIEQFLLFLGVAPEPPDGGVALTLIEGGEGDIEVENPPALVEAGPQWSSLRFGQLPGENDDEQPEPWLASLDASWDWLETLVEEEREQIEATEEGGRRSLEVLSLLRDRKWFPVGDSELAAQPPTFLKNPPSRVAPTQVTIVSTQQRLFPAVLWSISEEIPIEPDLLRALGVISGTDGESLGQQHAEPAYRLLTQLADLTASNLNAVEENPRTRQALTQLFGRLLNTIAREHDPDREALDIPLLVFKGSPDKRALSDRRLEWASPDQDAWIPTDASDRDQMRRFFAGVPLVAATIGRNTLRGYPPLSDRELRIRRHVYPVHTGSEEGEIIASLEEKLKPIIPHLLALAETTNQIEVDPATAADRWRSRVFRYVDDAWVQFEVVLGDQTRTSDPLFKGTHDHALYLESDPPTIIFDTSDDGDSHPPLDEFGGPLARLLLDDSSGGVGPTFAHALGALESGGVDRVERILRKHDAIPLVDAYERHLRQLDDEEYADLREKVVAVLDELGIGVRDSWIRISHIGPSDIDTENTPRDVTSYDVEEKFRSIDLNEDQEPFQPQFSCVEHHRKIWSDWLDSWQDRLLPYLNNLLERHTEYEFSESEISDHLDEYVREDACRRVAFEPTFAVIDWLKNNSLGVSISKDELPSSEHLEDQLIEFSPRYHPVEEVVTSADVGFARREVARGEPNEVEQGIVEIEDLEAKWEQTKAVGDEAERAIRTWIAERTAECLEQADSAGALDEVRNRLISAIPGSGKTAETLSTAIAEWSETRDPESLEPGLHVSQTWDGIGYDLIGLEESPSGFEPVRYEVKSLPGDGSRFKIHLTRNQLSVYRKIRIENSERPIFRGDWKLLGVEPERRAIDLTNELEALPTLLRTLQTEGYDHDGLLIYVEC